MAGRPRKETVRSGVPLQASRQNSPPNGGRDCWQRSSLNHRLSLADNPAAGARTGNRSGRLCTTWRLVRARQECCNVLRQPVTEVAFLRKATAQTAMVAQEMPSTAAECCRRTRHRRIADWQAAAAQSAMGAGRTWPIVLDYMRSLSGAAVRRRNCNAGAQNQQVSLPVPPCSPHRRRLWQLLQNCVAASVQSTLCLSPPPNSA